MHLWYFDIILHHHHHPSSHHHLHLLHSRHLHCLTFPVLSHWCLVQHVPVQGLKYWLWKPQDQMLEEGQKQPGGLWLVQALGQVELPDDGNETTICIKVDCSTYYPINTHKKLRWIWCYHWRVLMAQETFNVTKISYLKEKYQMGSSKFTRK